MSAPAEVERRALALVEQILDNEEDEAFAAQLLADEPELVRTRVAALRSALTESSALLPTEMPGGGLLGEHAQAPEQVGAFRIGRRLGAGGMGGVWLAERSDGLYEQKVAIKFIRAGLVHLAGSAFRAERQILARLEHPNIARLIDGGVTEDGTPYLVMEYVDGLPIDEAVQGKGLAEKVKLFVKAADAVQFAHARLVVHADLKPSNIFVDPQGRVKLLDFGISRLLEGGEGEDAGQALPMTAAYASPARIAGAPPSIADDVYALGIILSDLVGFSGDDDMSAIAAMARHEDEAQRYGSVAALIADLDRWRDQLPVTAREPTVRYRARLFVRRHRFGVVLTAAAVLALAALALVAVINAIRAENNRARAEQRFDEVRQLSKFLLYDLYDQLARQPGTVVKREEIAATSARYLARLNLSAETSPALRLDAARSYRRLAAIQGLSGTSNLGRPDEALHSLDRAEALLAQDAGPLRADFLTERGWVHLDRWLLQPDNAASARQNGAARGYFKQAQALAPDNVHAALGALWTEKNDAYDAIWASDDAAKSAVIAQKALTVLAARTWPADLAGDAAQLRISLLGILGEADYRLEKMEDALAVYREAGREIDQLIAARGRMPSLIIMKGQNAFDISGTMGDMPGRAAEALVIAQQGEVVLKGALAQGPDAAVEKKLLILYGQEALLLSDLGRAEDALVPSGASVALRERRLAGAPDDPQRMRDLAIGLGSHVDRLGEAGHRAQACAAARRTVGIWDRITALKRLGALDARKNVPKSQDRVKNFCA